MQLLASACPLRRELAVRGLPSPARELEGKGAAARGDAGAEEPGETPRAPQSPRAGSASRCLTAERGSPSGCINKGYHQPLLPRAQPKYERPGSWWQVTTGTARRNYRAALRADGALGTRRGGAGWLFACSLSRLLSARHPPADPSSPRALGFLSHGDAGGKSCHNTSRALTQ